MKKIRRLPYRDPFGYPLWAKRMVIFWFGTVTWYRLNRIHRTTVEGMEHLKDLPDENVLFVSNHQTNGNSTTNGKFDMAICADRN